MSPEQLEATASILAGYETQRYSILFAQMQSGKTHTYLAVACEMLRHRQIQHVVIFSGNAETELKKQTIKSRNEFIQYQYRNYLKDVVSDIDECICEMEDKIAVVWGAELDSYSGATEDALFIFEESHYAQNIGMRTDNFLQQCRVSSTGNNDILEAANNYVLSVSATPFSEVADNLLMSRDKNTVTLKSGEGYRGVKHFMDNDQIVVMENWNIALSDALVASAPNSYAIIRVCDRDDSENEVTATSIARSHGWNVIQYNAESVKRKGNMTSLDQIKIAPTQSTLIIIREMCRMGKRIDKTHLAFVMETAKSSKSDTVLQSLLGRCCGYHANDTLRIYISDAIAKNKEIERFIGMTEGNMEEIPKKARNMKRKTTTRNELFSHELESGAVFVSNGGFNIPILPETSTDAELMYQTLRECILRSQEPRVVLGPMPTRITSNQVGDKLWRCIYVSAVVLEALNSDIKQNIMDEFGVYIVCKKSRGKTHDEMSDMIRLSEISWHM